MIKFTPMESDRLDELCKTIDAVAIKEVTDVTSCSIDEVPSMLSECIERSRCAYLMEHDEHGLLGIIGSIEVEDYTNVWMLSNEDRFDLVPKREIVKGIKEIDSLMYTGKPYYAKVGRDNPRAKTICRVMKMKDEGGDTTMPNGSQYYYMVRRLTTVGGEAQGCLSNRTTNQSR